MTSPRELLDRLESRHDELIRKLDELNSQIEQALARFGKPRVAVEPAPAPSSEANVVLPPVRRHAA